uniref:Fibronectin type-III domain-containing protein n=1 Tax=Globodera pallida TaxID=36090 RepID=A0A183BVU5_GLOPA
MIRSVLFNLLPLLVIITFQHLAVNAFVSRRAKCSIECYTKCANSGTPIAVYCNCPLSIKNDLCNSVTEQLLTDKTVERLIESDSGYKDIRTIWLKVAPVPGAFIYIFEFSIQQSFDRPIWTFAGASSSPQITFAVPDACRDYQFRTIVVLRSTDTAQQLTVFRPKSIPPQLPSFTVPKESIQLDQPKQSKDKRTVHLSVSWQNPFGYDDVDVYGYSPPTAYPIRCQTPDDQIASPRLELVQGGAKMHLTIPADALRGKCRIYMEVRMLPRCVRIEPFDVQISVELDCQKFPDLHFCQKENGPKCSDVVDLWGKDNGEVIVVWQRPTAGARLPTKNAPLFYTVHWGPAQSPQDFPSIVSRRIVRNVEQRVPGNQTKLELSGVRPGIQYGLQICAFFSEVPVPPEESPFRTEPVIPFTCTPCNQPLLNAGGGNVSKSCIDCSKIEQAKEATTQTPSASAPRHSVQFISADTAVLDVFGANVLAGGGNAATTTAPERGEGWSRVDPGNGQSIQTTTAQIIQTTTAPERGEGWSRVDTANGQSIQTTTAQIIQSTTAPKRGEGWNRVDTANGQSIQTTTAQIIQTTTAPERGEGWSRVDTANGQSIQTKTTTAPERGEGWNRVDPGNEQIIRQSHSKTHKTEVPLELSKVEKAAKNAEELTKMEVPTKVEDVSETPEVGKKSETEGNTLSGRRMPEGVRTANPLKTTTGMMPSKSEEKMTNERNTMMNTRTTTMKMGETEEKKRTKADAEQRRGDEKRRASEEGERALKEEDEWIKTEEKKAEDGGMGKKKTKGWRTNSDEERGETATVTRARMTSSTVTSTTKTKAGETPTGSGSTTTEGKRNATEAKDSRNGPNSVQKEQHNHLQQQTRSKVRHEGEEGDQQQHKPERNAGAFGQFDRRKWMFAAPALFLFGLFVGLALLLFLVFRRRKTRHRQNNIFISNSQPNSRKYGRQKMRFPTGRSVLAARTMANECYAGNCGTIGFIGAPTIAMIPSVNGTSPSCSPSCSPSSAASSVSTVESRLGPGTSAAVQRLWGERERTLPEPESAEMEEKDDEDEDEDEQQMEHSGRDEKEEEDELERLRTEGAGGKRVVLFGGENGKESFGEQKEATRDEQRAEEKQLMASRKLSKSTSDLPNADLLMEYQRFDRRRGGAREEEAAAAATTLPVRMPLINDFVGGVGGSRFKITPVENRYKRGRWEVWDYYEDGAKRGNARRGEQMPPPPSFLPPSHLLLPQSPSATAPAGQTPSASHCHPPPMPRRNSFQLVTIRNIAIADEQRRNPSEPISASQERLNKLPSDDGVKALICCPSPSLCASAVPLSSPPSHLHPPHAQLLPQLQPLHAQLPAINDSSRATTPRIVEPESGEEQMRIDRNSSGGRGSTNSDATQHSFVMLLNQFGLEKSLTIGVENVLMCPVSSDNEKLQLNGLPITFCLASPAPSPPQTMSASFGPGQMQFDQQKGRKMSGERRTAVARRSSSASTGAVPAAQKGEGVVAIDSKIEQAMDLVKTHLIYAVRDEMELLRARIVHLEATVVQLETENAILRQHIPREVLDRLSKQQKTPHLLHNASVAAIAQ